jgi:hypothetical protein
MTLDLADLALAAIGLLISVLAYLLKRKDEEQAVLIKDLYDKHHADADRLHQVELKIAADHYVKAELDHKFDKVERALIQGFESLGNKFDALSIHLTAHIMQEDAARSERKHSQ